MDIIGEIHYDWPLESTLEVGGCLLLCGAVPAVRDVTCQCYAAIHLAYHRPIAACLCTLCVCVLLLFFLRFTTTCVRMQACAGADVGLVFVGSSMVELKKGSDGAFTPATEGEGLGESM